MIHEINPPACGMSMERIREFQEEVLKFACDSNTTWPPTAQTLENAFGKDKGLWLFERLWTKDKKGATKEQDLFIYLKKLVDYVRQNPGTGQQIVDAYATDVTFYASLNDPNFRFNYTQSLSPQAQDAVSDLMISFYTNLLLSTGFPESVHGQPGRFDRDAFLAGFNKTNENLRVCPGCDGRRPGAVGDKVLWDADHYLPKSKYPFLSVHPKNLVPLCIECNRSIKGSRNPIDDDADAPLPNMFHPYGNPAIKHLKVTVKRKPKGELQILIKDDAATVSRRVKSAQRVFRLNQRWPKALQQVRATFYDSLAELGFDRKSRNEPVTKQVLVSMLQNQIKAYSKRPGRFVNGIVENSYKEFALNDANELDRLFKEFRRDLD